MPPATRRVVDLRAAPVGLLISLGRCGDAEEAK